MAFGELGFGEGSFGVDSDDGLYEPTRFLSDHRNPPKDGTPRDLAINQRQDIFWAANGDLAVVNGRDNIQQSVAIDVLHTIAPNIGDTVTPTKINEVQSKIKDILEADPQIEGNVTVRVDSYNSDDGQLNFAATTTADDEYRIPIQSLADSYTSELDDGSEARYAVEDTVQY